MKLALVNGVKVEANPQLKGVCICCASEVVAKCGKINIWHWAHKSKIHCDSWWERETAWHRQWKNQFPVDWQEIVHTEKKTGEKHIADVKNPFGLVLEFQHSIINDDERVSRENFYKPMIWVVDGCRGNLDKSNFNIGI
jgi:competence protein CoiA